MVTGEEGNLESTGQSLLVRANQVGFAVELTSSWDTTTGYGWKQLELVGVAFTNPVLPKVGKYAVTPTGDTSLAAGTRGWLEQDVSRRGWMFQPYSTSFGGGSSSTAGGCGWAAGLTAAHCLEVTLLAVAGACACNPTTASKPFIITGNGSSWSYPGPPAPPVCGQCSDGSPESLTVTLTGGTGDFAALNGTYTLTRDAANKCLWVGSGGTGASAGLAVSGDAWTLTVTAGGTSATWTATRPGCCAPLAMTPGDQTGTGTRPAAGTVKLAAACPGTVLICGTAYSVTFSRDACGNPCLSLGTGGSGGSIKGVLESCARNVATFVVGGSLCPGCDPSANFARIQVRLARCGWQGPGWYCVRDCGTNDACVAVELLEGDQYDLTIEICAGPFESEEEAEEACGPVTMQCCGDVELPRVVRATISGFGGLANGTYDLIYNNPEMAAHGLPAANSWTHYIAGDYASNVGYFGLDCVVSQGPGIAYMSGTVWSGGAMGSFSENSCDGQITCATFLPVAPWASFPPGKTLVVEPA